MVVLEGSVVVEREDAGRSGQRPDHAGPRRNQVTSGLLLTSPYIK